MKPETRLKALRILAIAVVIALSVAIFALQERVAEFATLGYPGIFLFALLVNSTILLPTPGIVLVFALGAVLNPFGVALAAASGGTIGEMSGYLAGFSGRAVVENTAAYGRIQPWVQKWGGWGILAVAAFPNPLFDLVGIAAGTLKMPVGKFFVYCFIGKLIKMSAVAYAGSQSVNWFLE